MANRALILDLYCCAGGAATGYYRAGFDVLGVDISPQPNYPFRFIQADAIEFLERMVAGGTWEWIGPGLFAAAHASPPCQAFLNLGAVNRALGRPYEHDDLIAATRDLLEALSTEWDIPYVIENVPDARAKLRDPVRVCGTHFGLPLRRHRLFESNVPLVGTPCAHDRFTEPRYWTGWRPKGEKRLSTVVQVYGNAGGKHEWPVAMGIDWMTNDEMAEAVPPAYTEHIGQQLLAQVQGEALAA